MPKYTDYMVAGYVLAFLIMLIIIGSIWWRYRYLEKDEALIQQLEEDNDIDT